MQSEISTNSSAADEKEKEDFIETGLGGLTINDLKRYKGFEDQDEVELNENLNTIKTIARIIATMYHQQNK